MTAPPHSPHHHPTCVLRSWSHTPGHKGGLILNSVFSCGNHGCICPSLARLPVPAALKLQAAGSSGPGLWGSRAGKGRELNELSRRRGRRKGFGWGICTFPHLLDTRQILWPAHPNPESGPPQCQEPAAAEAMSAPGWPTWERSGKTHSMAGLPGPDAARPLVRPASTPQTNQAHVGADSTALAGCRVILGAWGPHPALRPLGDAMGDKVAAPSAMRKQGLWAHSGRE